MLVVEDEPALVELVRDVVGPHRLPATSRRRHLKRPGRSSRSQSVDLLVTDVNLPDGDGMTCCSLARKKPGRRRDRDHRQADVSTARSPRSRRARSISCPSRLALRSSSSASQQGAGRAPAAGGKRSASDRLTRRREEAERLATDDQQEGRSALQRPGHRVRRTSKQLDVVRMQEASASCIETPRTSSSCSATRWTGCCGSSDIATSRCGWRRNPTDSSWGAVASRSIMAW